MNDDLKPNLLKPRWSKVFTDLWEDKTRTGLVVASIAVGVFAIGMIINAYVILGQDINHSYEAVNPPNIDVQTDPFDKDLVHVIEKIPGVDKAEGRRTMQVRARRVDENWQNLKLVAVSDFSGSINLLDPIEGTQFAGEDQILISQNMMHVTGYKIGDVVEIELPDGSNRDLIVVGLVTDQSTAKPDPGSTNNVYMTLKTLSSFGQDDYFNQLYVTVSKGSDSAFINSVSAAVEDKIKNSGREVYRTDDNLSTEHPMTDSILAVIGVLGILGGLITVLSSSLIIN